MSFSAQVPIVSLLLLLTAAACGVSPAPTSLPADLPTPTGPLDLSLSVLPGQASPGKVELALTLANDGEEPVYLAICGPWEVHQEGDPDRPVWLGICEVDYLGHQVAPGAIFSGTLQAELDIGRYRARTWAFGDCTLAPPQEVSAQEINYGAFGDCAVAQEVTSAPIVIE
jgi:hypothetical protein